APDSLDEVRDLSSHGCACWVPFWPKLSQDAIEENNVCRKLCDPRLLRVVRALCRCNHETEHERRECRNDLDAFFQNVFLCGNGLSLENSAAHPHCEQSSPKNEGKRYKRRSYRAHGDCSSFLTACLVIGPTREAASARDSLLLPLPSRIQTIWSC